MVRVNGPLVEVEGLTAVAMSEVVELGPLGLRSEVVALAGQITTLQAYEYTGGLGPGAEVVATGEPLSAPLGPGLLGGIFDGLLRPLAGAGTWLTPGGSDSPDPRRWTFEPEVAPGDEVGGGQILGSIHGAGPVALRLLVPPGVAGAVEHMVEAGAYPADATWP